MAEAAADRSAGMNKYLVVHFLDSLSEGERFESSAWPLHLTLIPPFSTNAERSDLEQFLRTVSQRRPIDLKVSGKSLFGVRQDIPVMEVVLLPELRDLHEAVVNALEEQDVRHGSPAHIREGFRPHVTIQKSGTAEPGQTVRMDAITLVGYPTDRTREVLTHFPLGSGVVPSNDG
ncbi:MAG TPA: 2'-5' RNA ligase family protein [Patescibacteria group bacterium]